MRIALGIEYDGRNFCGWQTQPSRCSAQDALEQALTEIAGHDVATICAGRTDAGVHAFGQVVHFDSDADRRESATSVDAVSMGVGIYGDTRYEFSG